jgi:hypothetical protein
LHDIDKTLLDNKIFYIRYVDDFRFFGFRKHEVLNCLHEADILCKKHGLIPQSSKIAIQKINSIDDFKTFQESGDPDETDDGELEEIASNEAEDLFFSSVDEKKGIFLIKSNIKYVLKRAGKSPKIKAFVLNHASKNLQFIEEIFTFLENYLGDSEARKLAEALLSNRFDFVRAQSWFFLAKSITTLRSQQVRSLAQKAINEARLRRDNTLARMGSLLFLIKSERCGYGAYANFIATEPLWFIKAALAPELPTRCLTHQPIIDAYFGRTSFEPSLMLGPHFLKTGTSPGDVILRRKVLKSQAKNTYRELGFVHQSAPTQIDPIGEILSYRYGVQNWTKWKRILGQDYKHALGILKQGGVRALDWTEEI